MQTHEDTMGNQAKKVSLTLTILASFSGVILGTAIYILSANFHKKILTEREIGTILMISTSALLLPTMILCYSAFWCKSQKNKGREWYFPKYIWISNAVLSIIIILLIIVYPHFKSHHGM